MWSVVIRGYLGQVVVSVLCQLCAHKYLLVL